jgi:hypothetical protein
MQMWGHDGNGVEQNLYYGTTAFATGTTQTPLRGQPGFSPHSGSGARDRPVAETPAPTTRDRPQSFKGAYTDRDRSGKTGFAARPRQAPIHADRRGVALRSGARDRRPYRVSRMPSAAFRVTEVTA